MEKSVKLIQKIIDLVNEGKKITFTEDCGGNNVTLWVDNAHTHIGWKDFRCLCRRRLIFLFK